MSEKYRTRLPIPLAVSHHALHLLADVEHLFSTEARLDVSLCFFFYQSYSPFPSIRPSHSHSDGILYNPRVRYLYDILYRCRPALTRAVDLHVSGFLSEASSNIYISHGCEELECS